MSEELVTIIRGNISKDKPREPLKRTLKEATKKYFSKQNQRMMFMTVEGYEEKDGKLVKKATTKKTKE